jgi:hypothetical protein
MQIIIELKKHENKDYTLFVYEGWKIFPVLSIKKPVHWNKCVKILSEYLRNKQIINVFQKKSLEDNILTITEVTK